MADAYTSHFGIDNIPYGIASSAKRPQPQAATRIGDDVIFLAELAIATTDGADRFDERRPGLDHIGFACRDRAELEKLRSRLEELGIEHGGIADDALGHGLSFRDPDGVALELWAPRS